MLYGIRFWDELNASPADDVARLVARLSLEPWSEYRAAVHLGGPEWLGWGHQERILADLYDALTFNTAASGVNPKAKPPSGKHQYPRPQGVRKKKSGAALPSVDD